MRIALALPAVLEDRVAGEALRHGHDVIARFDSAAALESAIGELRPEAVIVAAAPMFLSASLLAACDEIGCRTVGLIGMDVDRRHAASIGLREVVDATAPWSNVEQIMRPTIAMAAPVASPRRGRVIAVWGPAGAPGRTTIAATIAAEIAAAGFSVALGDVDTHSASIAPVLGLLDEAPGFAAACRLAGTDSLTIDEFERVAQRYWSPNGSFWVLTGIGRPSRWPELSATRVAATIERSREWVDFTVLDTGFSLENDEEISSDLFAPRRNAATVTALRDADQVIAVGAADPIGLSRLLRSHVELLEVVAPHRIAVVANRIRASAIGMNPSSQVAQTLSRFGGITAAALVPDDRTAVDAAILTGRTLTDAAPKSPARLAIAELVAARILPQPERAQKRRGALVRRFRPVTASG